jgi:hypothetical protein
VSARPSTRDAALAGALLLGLLADALVRVPGRPGLNVTLWALAGTAVLWFLSSRREAPVAAESRWLVGGALLFAALLVLRDADALAAFSLLAAVVLLGLAAGRGARAWAVRSHIVDVAAAALRVAGLMALGPLGWSLGAARPAGAPTPPGARGRAWPRYARMAARGTAMALPPLLVLTALLASADPVFEGLLHAAFFADFEPLLEHLAFAGAAAWFTSGYLRAALVRDDGVLDRVRVPRPGLAPAEIAVALSLLNLLFLVFLAVQVRYLFGGAGLVEATAGLTYAEYARRGFFELVVAAALVVPLLLVADWAAEEEGAARRVLRATSLLLVLLLAGVLASAAYRMRLYQDAYGLTESRLYVSVFMVWLTAVLGWLAATVLRGRRRRFAFGAIAAGLACVAGLHALNPHALIARVNVERTAAGAEVDGRYLATLSADAVPALVALLPALPAAERCRVAAMLDERWSASRPGGWRTWNLADARARRLVRELPAVAGCGEVPVALPGAARDLDLST